MARYTQVSSQICSQNIALRQGWGWGWYNFCSCLPQTLRTGCHKVTTDSIQWSLHQLKRNVRNKVSLILIFDFPLPYLNLAWVASVFFYWNCKYSWQTHNIKKRSACYESCWLRRTSEISRRPPDFTNGDHMHILLYLCWLDLLPSFWSKFSFVIFSS